MGTVKKLYQDQLVGGSGSAGQEVYPVTSTLGVYDTDNNQLQSVLDKVTTNLGLFTCGTAAATAAKTVSASKFVLMEGGSVKIKFTYANSADSPTLAIGSTAAKPIMFNGSAASASNSWGAGEIVEFFYDGTNWVGSSTSVSVSQNTSTGHTDITIGSTTTPVASVEEVSQLGQKSVEIGNSGNLADLDIADENGNILARLSSGNIKTKNFDSATTPKIDVSDEADFEVADDDNNVLLQLKGGHIKTKNFDSAQLGQAATHIVHFSFDDGEYSIIHLFANNYSSVWDSPFFGFLKTLHQYFGAVFTINLFISTFSVITNRYATELGAAASWLKFSLHGDKTQNYGEPGGLYPGGRTSGGQDWTDMVSAVVTLTGTPNAIDRHTRLSNFAGTETNLLNMRDNKFGAICFSAADEYPRLSYDFDNNEEKFVWDNEFYFNSKTRLYFVRSYARLDDLTINSATLATMKSYIEQRGFSEFFIHEYSVYNSNGIVNAGVTKLNAFFNFIHSNNYKCDFFKLTI